MARAGPIPGDDTPAVFRPDLSVRAKDGTRLLTLRVHVARRDVGSLGP
jgi:hypothetical protein